MSDGNRSARLVLLSAGGPEQLDRYVRDILQWLTDAPSTPQTLDRLVYTLLAGREPLTERLAVVVSSLGELAERLRGGQDVYRGTARGDSAGPVVMTESSDLAELARLWVAGTTVLPVPGRRPARLSLPTPPPVTRRYWIDPPAELSAAAATGPGRRLTGREFYLRDHALGEVRILPAVMALEFAVAEAARAGHGRATGVKNVLWGRPVLVSTDPVEVRVHLDPVPGGLSYELRADGELCSTGTLDFDEPEPAARLDLDAVRDRCSRVSTGADCYALFAALGGDYGPSLQGLRHVAHRPGEALAEVAVPEAADLPFDAFTLHPSLLDAMLQTALWTEADPAGVTERKLPFTLTAVERLGPLPRSGHVHAVATAHGHDLTLTDGDGRVALRMRGVITRAIGGAPTPAAGRATHVLVQRRHSAPAVAAGRTPAHVVVVGDRALADALGAAARSPGDVFEGTEPLLVVHAGADDPFADVVELFRAWTARKDRGPVRLLHLFTPAGDVRDAYARALDGAFRVIAGEHPTFHAGILETDGIGTGSLVQIIAAEADADHEFHVRYTSQGRTVLRWEPAGDLDEAAGTAGGRQPSSGAPGGAPRPSHLTPDGVYLVTGGAGAIGRHVVAHLGGAARFILTGRSATADLGDLRARGVDAHYLPADLGSPGAAADLVARVHDRFGPINGVLHLAGVTRDSFLMRKTDAEIAAVLGPKVRGTVELDRATAGDPLEFFVTFSSMSGAAGSPGQADYAYANRFLDAFVAWRSGSDRPGRSLSVLWSLWAEGGIKPAAKDGADDATGERLSRQVGLWPLPTDAALAALDRAFAQPHDQVLVAHGHLDQLGALLDRRPAPEQRPAAAAPAMEVSAVAEGTGEDRAQDFLRGVLATVFDLPAEDIDADTAFEQYGIDSLLIMDLTRRLEEHFGSLPKTLFFEYQDLRSLAGYFTEQHAARLAELAPASAPVPVPRVEVVERAVVPSDEPSRVDEPIAIIGVGARFAESPTMAAFWANLRAGRDLITEIPADRWDWRDYDQATEADREADYSRWGSFLDGIDRFDPLFFGISPREAEIIDPQERLFLQTAWHAMEDAGYTRADLRPRRVGVYVGAMYALYQLHEADNGRIAASSYASIANRVSYTFGLTGPSMAVDTMCSSALSAIHLAIRDIRNGDADMAFAGGVNLHVHPYKYRFLGQGKFTSSDGRCRSFGADGDGYVPGEGVGAVLLKPLSAARRDGDHVHGVILGSSVNHGGRTNGFTVPNPVAQSDLVGRALADAGADPGTLDYLEAHGTGTALGDPVEIRGLARAFAAAGLPEGSLPIGSVKSNVGHLESASGMAGLCKVLLQMRHHELVPSLHAEPPNPNIDWATTPLRVQRETAPWPGRDGRPLRAGISSFGAGGSNAHLVIEEHRESAGTRSAAGPWLFPLSAKTAERLRVLAGDLAGAIDPDAGPAWLADVAYTLSVGREEFADRLVVRAASATELIDRLRAMSGAGVWQGEARGRTRPTAPASAGLDAIAAAWIAGADIDWAPLHTGDRRRVPLPGYPFEQLRCWITDVMWRPRVAAVSEHPLLGEVDAEQSVDGLTYRTTFGPGHPLIADHVVGDLRLLPGAAALEMAHAAAGRAGLTGPVVLRGVRWLRPLVVADTERDTLLRMSRTPGGLGFELTSDGEPLAAGRVEAGQATTESLTVPEILDRCPVRHDGAELYADLAAAGLVYGDSLRGVEWIAAGRDEAVARIVVPAAASRFTECALSPTAVDSALHTFAVLRDRSAGPAMVPFAVTAVEVASAAPASGYAHVRVAGPDRYDLTLADDQGRVCVRLRDLALRPAPGSEPVRGEPIPSEPNLNELMFTPAWSPVPERALPDPAAPSAPAGDTWIVRGPESAPLATELAAALGGDPIQIEPERIDALTGTPTRIVLLSGPAQGRTDDPHALEAAQNRGVLTLFRLAKRITGAVSLTVVTEDALAVAGEPVANPFAAALHGLALSLAQEYPRWRVSVLDRSSTDDVRDAARAVGRLDTGGPYALRAGVLYARHLLPVPAGDARTTFRRDGVYLILGGAGGIGLELTEWLVRGHHARVVLVGRGELDQARHDRLRTIDPSGDLVSYRRADARDAAALRAVVEATRRDHGALHGVVHATIVLRDQSVAMMTEDVFRDALEAKTRTSVALHAALGAEPLDFVVFFSSAVALSGSAGQSNYAAGSAFEDAFAHHLDGRLSADVKVINWGFWGTVGIVASDDYRQRLARTGIHSITPAEGMAAIRQVLGRDDRQVLVIKADRAVLTAAGVRYPDVLLDVTGRPPVPRLLTEADSERLDRIMLDWLWTLFRAEGSFVTAAERWTEAELAARIGVRDGQRRLFAELLRVLTAGEYLRVVDGALVSGERVVSADPEADLVALCEHTPALNRFDRLLRPCMADLFGVLRGAVRATDVMFPGGSTALVEGAYRGSPVVDRANELVVDAVRALLSTGRPLTVLEIGAGTGGTTAGVLEALGSSGADVTYIYTDISRAFLQHGRERFARQYPFVRFQPLDISADVSAQGFQQGGADLVVAANVLHATEDLLPTLRRVVGLLRPGGRLVLNEATSNVITATLTFGLLDGWWLNRDAHLRLPGAPLLSGDGWRHALELAGFARSQAIPADEGLTQHVVIAETDTATATDMVPEPVTAEIPAGRPEPVTAGVPAGEPDMLIEAARTLVRGVFEDVLQVPQDRLWLDETYENFGVDSLTVPRIADLIGARVGELPATLLFEHPTIRDLADFLVQERPDAIRALLPAAVPAALPAAAPAAVPAAAPTAVPAAAPIARTTVTVFERAAAPADRRIAVIGVAGRYPMAADVEEFWDNLQGGRDCVREVPADRWDWRTVSEVAGMPVSRWGGFLDGIDEFDPKFFQLSLREAELIDPQERLFLQTAWHALDDAGYPRTRLRGRRVGVYVGVMYGHYQLLENDQGLAGGMGYASIANRVSYTFDFHGPSLAVDTMCSSSLTAIQLACEALAAGGIDYALAGGVNLTPHPRKYRQLAAGGFTSADGRCRSFGAGGDGMAPGEGVGAVLLKPLAEAQRDGDRILGVILAGAANHGGKTGGFAVPNPTAQGDLIAGALSAAAIDPATVSYVEAHGTGTALGDPTEIAGLVRAFGQRPPGAAKIALGSVKSSIGHLESAAGVAALTKVLLQLRARKLAPSLHAQELNPAVDWSAVPFTVQREPAPWTGSAPLRAGISAFGAGGSNAHLIVEEFPEPVPVPVPGSGLRVFPFSARDAEALRAVVRGVLDVIRAGQPAGDPAGLAAIAGVPVTALDDRIDELGLDPTVLLRLLDLESGDVPEGMTLRQLAAVRAGGRGAVDLDRLAFTLQVGREPMACRLAVVADSVAVLTERLSAFLAGRPGTHLYEGTVSAEPVRSAVPGDPRESARRWATGEDFDWAGAYTTPPMPMSLPGYPFARVRCWIDEVARPVDVRPPAGSVRQTTVGRTSVRQRVLELLSGITGFPAAELDPKATFHDHGLDSLSVIRLAGEIGEAFDVRIGPDQLLATPTVAALVDWLVNEKNVAPLETATPPAEDDPVVIVGMAGVLPGSADLEEFWANLGSGEDLIRDVPADRWDARAVYGDPARHPDRTRVGRAGFMPDVDRFDPLFFGISPREAQWMDPRQRLLLTTVWSAIEDAGIDPGSLAGTRTGLFVGVGPSEYAELIQRSGVAVEAYASTGLAPSMLANRISYLLDLRGPSEPVDTACSSSLVALHRAAEAIQLGHCDTVIAGGVSVLLSPVSFASLERAGMLSPDGVGRAFDKDASGYVRGEGVGAVVLKRMSQALADGNPICAVLRGTAVNHGGRANSLTAPNPAAQAEVIVAAHRRAGLDPATIGYIETHGTGTMIGDPAETNGLREAFAQLYREWGYPAPAAPHCALGALKNVIGHLEPAAGIAAVLRVLLSMRHGRIPGNPNVAELNPYLGLDGTPFDVPVTARDWPRDMPRRAGISGFGYGGVNAHVVLEEYQPADRQDAGTDGRPVVFTLSARDPERLRAYVQAFVDAPERWIHDLAGTAYTLQAGRTAHAARLAFPTHSGEHALSALRAFLAGDITGVHVGQVARDTDSAAEQVPDGGTADEIAAAWVRGARVDWARHHAGPSRRRSLPTYPFTRQRYWFTDRRDAGAARPGGTADGAAGTSPASAEAPAGVSFFVPEWRPARVRSGEHGDPPLVFGDLPVPGAVVVRPGAAFHAEGDRFEIQPDVAEDYVRVLTDLRARGLRVTRVLHAWTLGEPDFGRRVALGVESLFLLVRALMASTDRPQRIQAFVPEDGALAEAYGGYDAALRAVLPGTAFCAVRVADGVDQRALLAEAMVDRVDAASVRLTPEGRWTLAMTEIQPSASGPSPLRPDGVYLITGGLGGLGVLLAGSLLRRGCRVVLVGRSAVADGDERLTGLRALGPVEYHAADVADAARMAAVVAETTGRWGALRGVFHLAGTASANPLPGKDLAELRAHLRPRIEGARVLDEVTRDQPLDVFVLYSSIAGSLGDYGLVDYAVGARFLDGFAHARPGRTLAVDWPMWRDGGMHVEAEDERRYLATTGFRYLEADEGDRVLDLLLRGELRQVAVLPGEPERMRALVAGTRVNEVSGSRRSDDTWAGEKPESPRSPAEDGSGAMAEELRGIIGEIVGIPASALDPDAGFGEYGLDSFGLQTLATALTDRYGVTVATTALFAANTIAKLSRHLTTEFGLGRVQPPSASPSVGVVERAPVAAAGDAIAVIGMSGRFPGSPDLDAFWANLAAERDLITETPADRWDWREVARRYGGTARWGGFLDEIDRFDPAFFKMSPLEAQVTDPQHRLFLERTWAALEDAGLRADRLAGRPVCVFAGVQFTDYESMVLAGRDTGEVNAYAGTGLARTMLANRVSYLLDLRGPSESIDTACSSSLVALHRAVRSLRSGESELAIAGGVSLVLTPQTVVAGNQLGVLSPDGRCKTLDVTADGYVKGEGVAVLILKPLARALADGDRVHAVIRGSAVNHGGHASSLTAPNPLAQADLLVAAYRDADVPIETVSYLELHGTGTKLGDPVEVDAITRAHRTLTRQEPVTCAIGTVKSNIGHLEPAAGIAGVVKVILSMSHRALPASLHLRELNPLIQLADTPFEPVRHTREWTPATAGGTPLVRRAGVSSFGFGGVNAHVVLEEPPAETTVEPGTGPQVLLLSARDEDALRRYAVAMAEFLDHTTASLASIAYTSQTGRVPMAVRLAVVAGTVADARARLGEYLAGGSSHRTVTGGHEWLAEPEGHAYLRRLSAEGRWESLARLWQDGADLDWRALRTDRVCPTSMPTYPFARDRHWLPAAPAGTAGVPAPAADDVRLLVKRWEPAPASGPVPLSGLVVLARAGGLDRARAAFGPDAQIIRWSESADPEDGARIARGVGPVSAVLDLVDHAGPDEDGPDESVDWARIVLVRELVAANRAEFTYLHVTRGLTTFQADRPTLRGAAFAGLIRMLSAEYRGVRARTIDVDGTADLRAVVAAEMGATDPVTEICVRAGTRYRPVLRDADVCDGLPDWAAPSPVLITGGTGALGRLVAGRLIERGAETVILLGRSSLPERGSWPEVLADPGTDPGLARRLRDIMALERPGVRVLTASVPLDDPAELTGTLERLRAEVGPIAGIVHCAGMGDMANPAFIGKQVEQMRSVLAPKVTGPQALLAACAEDPLRLVVLYSSIAAQAPALAAGMSDYALANSFLDRFAEYRTATGTGPVVRSVQWPSWRSDGMPEVDTPAYRDLGLRTLDPAVALDLLERAIAGPDPVVLPCVVDPERFDAGRLLAVRSRPPAGTSRRPASASTAGPVPAPGGAVDDLVHRVTVVLAETLRLDAAAVRPDADFTDLGVDSIIVAQLVAALERELGTVVEPGAVLENPTVELLAAALRDQVRAAAPAVRVPEPVCPEPTPDAAAYPAGTPGHAVTRVAQVSEPARPEATSDGIAVIGMACHFPGAPDHQAFWRNLMAGVDSVTEVPASRWDAERLYRPMPEPGHTVSKWGGFLDGVEDFDPDFFGLDPAGAAHVDPLIRQFLETSAECLADAGLAAGDLAGKRVGVFAGARSANFGAHHLAAGPHSISGMAQNFIAAHVSHFLDVHGPAVVVDSACSSALVALHLAGQSLLTGESDLALAGGVEILLDEIPFVGMSEAGALSPTGRCHTFDQRADGIVLGEGAGTLLLKRLSDALRDGDRVYAVIEGSAVNNDGRTMGITTPNPIAQRDVIERALRAARVPASAIGYVEAHGTGTLIGDPIELKALTEVFRADTDETAFCGVGSVKTNIGHTLSAAGIAGVIKVVLSVWHGQLPPTLHCAQLNRRFRFEESPFYPVREYQDWMGRDGVRRGSVSSFGFGGTNAHVVVRQVPDGHVPVREPLPAPRYRRRRFWFEAAAEVAPALNNGAASNGATPCTPFFELKF